jgi:hypothetical protein
VRLEGDDSEGVVLTAQISTLVRSAPLTLGGQAAALMEEARAARTAITGTGKCIVAVVVCQSGVILSSREIFFLECWTAEKE